MTTLCLSLSTLYELVQAPHFNLNIGERFFRGLECTENVSCVYARPDLKRLLKLGKIDQNIRCIDSGGNGICKREQEVLVAKKHEDFQDIVAAIKRENTGLRIVSSRET